jgi:uncharacterized protein YbdZ (MbtH family)
MGWNDPDREDTTTYKVVVNHEEQYSIWPDYKENPLGWNNVGKAGSKAECLAYIKEVWTDMRPLSLRKKMEALENNPPAPLVAPTSEVKHEKSLVHRLCEGKHAVEVGLRPEKTVAGFKKAVDNNYVYIKFTQTKGGTELGFRLDQNSSDFTAADFENGKGTAHVEGNLVLDYVMVKCIADIDLSTLQGTGQLVEVERQQATVA